jgi:hypothetical protein
MKDFLITVVLVGVVVWLYQTLPPVVEFEGVGLLGLLAFGVGIYFVFTGKRVLTGLAIMAVVMAVFGGGVL